MAKTKDKMSGAVSDARPYIERALKDDEVRDNVRSAVAAARAVYDELVGGRGVTQLAGRVATDKDIQDNLKSALDDLRTAADRVQGKSSHKSRNTVLLVAGIALGALFNPMTGPATRRWISDAIFGGGDDYSYDGSSSSYEADSSSSYAPDSGTADSSTMPSPPPGESS